MKNLVFKIYDSIKNFLYRRILVFRDIKLYYVASRNVKKFSQTRLWKEHNLKHDWLYRPYTILNFPADAILDPTKPEDYKKKLAAGAYKVNMYLASCNFTEFLIPTFKKIDGYNSYLLLYKPVFFVLSWRYVFWNVLGYYIFFKILFKFLPAFSNPINKILELIIFIFK